MTEELYLPDQNGVLEFDATVEEATSDHIVLDGTYFHVKGGGQPGDSGTISWDGGTAHIKDTRRDHGDILHYIDDFEGDLPEPGTEVWGEIDAERRETLRRLHTAQHLLSRIILEEHRARTIGNNIEIGNSWIDVRSIGFEPAEIEAIEERAQDLIDQDLVVNKSNKSRDTVESAVSGGRKKLLEDIPNHIDPLRVVEIGDIDICPCGGTHVDRLGTIGGIIIEDWETKKGGQVRIQFDTE